ncbi:gelation factor-like [Amphiura filiformis]|uniref:gelation factor-like n=1 Tax=Amphiura filiformis TaxID=82378 RepID=UPI003B2145F7
MKGSPFSTVPDVDPERCTIQLGLASSSNRKRRAIVESVDSNGQRMIIGGTKVEATREGNSLLVQDNNDGTYTIDYDLQKESPPLHITINGTEMKGSPFITVPDVDPEQCTIQIGLGSSSNRKRRAIVESLDSKGQKMIIGGTKVEATREGNSLHVQDNNDGTYMIDYDLQKESPPLHITINGTEMKGSPFSTVPDVDPERCTIQLGLASSSNRKRRAIVESVDSNGQRMIIGGTKVEATREGNSLHVQDNNDGKYTIDYDLQKESPPLHITINGTEMKGSPFSTVPDVDPERCTIQLGLASSSNRKRRAIVESVDSNGQRMIIGGTKVEATREGNSLHVQDNNDGKYTIDYDLQKESPPLHITINGTEMKGSPFSTVPDVDPERCTIQLGLASSSNRSEEQLLKV